MRVDVWVPAEAQAPLPELRASCVQCLRRGVLAEEHASVYLQRRHVSFFSFFFQYPQGECKGSKAALPHPSCFWFLKFEMLLCFSFHLVVGMIRWLLAALMITRLAKCFFCMHAECSQLSC